MSRTERFNLRLTPEERQEIDAAAKNLGITSAEAARIGVTEMAKRIAKSGAANNEPQAEWLKRQPEWGGFIWRIMSGELTTDEALAECAKAIGARLKSEAAEQGKQAEEWEKWSWLHGGAQR